MDPLEAVLRPVASLLNRNIQAITPARELCSEMAGTVVAVRVRDTALATFFIIDNDVLELVTATDLEPDVIISGSLLSLASLGETSGESAIRAGSIDVSGDAGTAQRFQTLLALARPDIEEELSGIVGDVAAHRLGSIVRGIGRWSRDARSTMGANIREYLQEESRDVPSRYEVEKFSRNVGELRDDADRLEARWNRLRHDN